MDFLAIASSVEQEPLSLCQKQQECSDQGGSVVAIFFGIAFSFVLAFRDLTLRQPTETAIAIAVTLALGLAMFVTAKWSVIRGGTIVSFGPALMTRPMRRLYVVAYATIGCGSLLAMLFISSSGR